MIRLYALAVALALVGCSRAASPPNFAIAPGYRPQVLALPADAGDDFAACPGAIALAPMHGGVVAAGWIAWLVEPTQPAVLGVACDDHQHVFAVSRTAVSLLDAGAWQQLAPLPAGAWHVMSTHDSRVWVWGRADDGSWQIHQIRSTGALRIYADAQPIRAAALVGHAGIVTAIGPALIAWSATGTPTPLAKIPGDIDGLAVDDGGRIFMSSPAGIVALADAHSEPVAIAKGLHGELRMRQDVLYVRSRAQRAVIRISPQNDGGAPPAQ